MSTIVVGVEGSPDSMQALRWAAVEARLRGAVLRVVHAYPTAGSPQVVEQLDGRARDLLDLAVAEAEQTAPEITVVAERVRNQSAAQALVAAAAGADLLVVGSRGLGGFTGLLVGSVSSQCVHHALCPVTIVRQPEEGGAGRGDPVA